MNTIRPSLARWSAVLLIAGLSLGCGKSDDKPKFLKDLVPVTGTVTINGKPAAGAAVRFIPPTGPDAHSAEGTTDAEGKYSLVTSAPHVSRKQMQGALPGDYTVVISRVLNSDGSPAFGSAEAMAKGAKESLPPQYSDESKTKLKATVSAGSGPINFDLKVKGR